MKQHPRIVTRLMGGLGNQMFQYAAGRALSIRLGVELTLDVADYEIDPLRHFELDQFAITAGLVGLETRTVFTSGGGKLGRLLGRCLGRATRRIHREPHFHYDPTFDHLSVPVYLDGYWQSERYFKGIADVLRREFTPVAPPNDTNAVLLEHIAEIEAVSLHVRRGDYVSNPTTAAFHGLCSLDYYRRAVDHVSRFVSQPHFFLFSDDPAWVRENLRLEYPCTIVDHNTGDGVSDMALMRACSHHIIANSSFSWWGAWLGERPEKIVVAPTNWFRESDKDTADLLPPQWTVL